MATETKDNPGVIAPPPLIFLSGVMLGFLVNYFFPFGIFLPRASTLILGALLIVVAAVILFLALRAMSRAKTNVEPWKPTTAIVDDGVYGFSRNPIYLAMSLIQIGVALVSDSLWISLFLAPVLLVIHFGVILREEKYLTDKFGADYLAYKARVRRWI